MLVNVWLTSDDFQKIFSNVESILSCNEILLKDLEADAIGSHIGDTMLRIVGLSLLGMCD